MARSEECLLGRGDSTTRNLRLVDEAIELRIEVDPVGVARLTRLAAAPWPAADDAGAAPFARPAVAGGIPLVDVILAGEGRAWSGSRYCESVAGRRMRYLGHERVRLADGGRRPVAGLSCGSTSPIR